MWGLSAYQTLTTATAYGYIQIPLDNILILKDIEVESEPMAAAIVSAKEKPPEKKDDEETGEQGKGTKKVKGTQEQEEKKEEPKKYICSNRAYESQNQKRSMGWHGTDSMMQSFRSVWMVLFIVGRISSSPVYSEGSCRGSLKITARSMDLITVHIP